MGSRVTAENSGFNRQQGSEAASNANQADNCTDSCFIVACRNLALLHLLRWHTRYRFRVPPTRTCTAQLHI